MNTLKSISVISTFLLTLSICSAQDTDFKHYKIDIHSQRTSFFDFIEHIEIVPLEETERSLLPRIEFYYKLQNGFGIRDYNTNSLVLFEDDGTLRNVINRFGEGPEEYKNLGTVWEENGRINLFSSQSRSVLKFDLAGNYLETVFVKYPKTIWGGILEAYKDGYVVQMLDRSPINRASYHLMFLDNSFKDRAYGAVEINPHPFKPNMGHRFSYLDENLIWKKQLSDSIFIIENDRPQSFMKFDFGEDWTWSDPLASSTVKTAFNAIRKEETKVWEVLSEVSEKYVLLTYKFTILKDSKGLIDRKIGRFYRLDMRKKNREDYDIIFLQWEGDRLISSLQAYDVAEFLENLDESQYSIAGGLKYEDFKYSENPVLLRIKFK